MRALKIISISLLALLLSSCGEKDFYKYNIENFNTTIMIPKNIQLESYDDELSDDGHGAMSKMIFSGDGYEMYNFVTGYYFESQNYIFDEWIDQTLDYNKEVGYQFVTDDILITTLDVEIFNLGNDKRAILTGIKCEVDDEVYCYYKCDYQVSESSYIQVGYSIEFSEDIIKQVKTSLKSFKYND